jgi:hypothetical protein
MKGSDSCRPVGGGTVSFWCVPAPGAVVNPQDKDKNKVL